MVSETDARKASKLFPNTKREILGWRGMRIEIFMKLIKQLLTLIVYTTILCQKCTINPRISTLSKKALYKTRAVAFLPVNTLSLQLLISNIC